MPRRLNITFLLHRLSMDLHISNRKGGRSVQFNELIMIYVLITQTNYENTAPQLGSDHSKGRNEGV